MGRIDARRVQVHDEVLGAFGLSAELPAGASASELVALMARDKKAHHSLTFVLDGPSGIEVVSDVDPTDVLATLRAMGAAP
jgi:5-deoxy-5-amino-3-dehydroquinate synthase